MQCSQQEKRGFLGSTHLSSFGWSRRCRRSLTTDCCSSVFSAVFPKPDREQPDISAKPLPGDTPCSQHPRGCPAALQGELPARITKVVLDLGKAQPLAQFYWDLQETPIKESPCEHLQVSLQLPSSGHYPCTTLLGLGAQLTAADAAEQMKKEALMTH